MNEQYFFVHKLGLGKEVVSLSLVVMQVSRGGGMRWWRQEVGLQISWKRILKGYYVTCFPICLDRTCNTWVICWTKSRCPKGQQTSCFYHKASLFRIRRIFVFLPHRMQECGETCPESFRHNHNFSYLWRNFGIIIPDIIHQLAQIIPVMLIQQRWHSLASASTDDNKVDIWAGM